MHSIILKFKRIGIEVRSQKNLFLKVDYANGSEGMNK